METHWDKLCRPPESALKTIQNGRLRGKSDINPQWRIKAVTDVYGPCGIGWRFDITKLWTEQGPDGQVFAFASVNLYTKDGNKWSEPIPGVGGHMLVAKEKNGLYANDECYKMAVTDALSTAMKMIGVAADIYMGLWDGSKYLDRAEAQQPIPQQQSIKNDAKAALSLVKAAREKSNISAEDLQTFVQMKWGDPKKSYRVDMVKTIAAHADEIVRLIEENPDNIRVGELAFGDEK